VPLSAQLPRTTPPAGRATTADPRLRSRDPDALRCARLPFRLSPTAPGLDGIVDDRNQRCWGIPSLVRRRNMHRVHGILSMDPPDVPRRGGWPSAPEPEPLRPTIKIPDSSYTLQRPH